MNSYILLLLSIGFVNGIQQSWRIVNESMPSLDYYTRIIDQAFKLIEKNSRYKFIKVNQNADIKIYLMENEFANSSRLGYAWEGQVFLNINLLPTSEVLYSVAIHEIKHALGIKHDYVNFNSIMYPYFIKIHPWNESLSVYDRFRLKRFINKRHKKQCFDYIDSISRITPYTWIAFRKGRYYRIDTHNGNIRWGTISELFPFRVPHPRIDSFFRLDNGTFGVVSKNNYWLFNYLPEEIVAKGLVNETFNVSHISAAMGYENGLLIISNNTLLLVSKDGEVYSNKSLSFKPFPTDRILGIYLENEYYIVILLTDGRLIYSNHDKELHIKTSHIQKFKMCPPHLLLSGNDSSYINREMLINILIVYFAIYKI